MGDLEVGGFLFGYPIVAVYGSMVVIRLPSNITVVADATEARDDLEALLKCAPPYAG